MEFRQKNIGIDYDLSSTNCICFLAQYWLENRNPQMFFTRCSNGVPCNGLKIAWGCIGKVMDAYI